MSEPRKVFIDTFEYIKQLIQLGQEPVYSVSQYRNVEIRENLLHARPGVNHSPDSHDGSPVWLEIDRLQRKKAPPTIGKLEPWLNHSDDPKIEPTIKEWRSVTKSLQEVDEMIENGIALQENVQASLREPEMFDVRLFAENDTDIDLAFVNYMQKKWLPWSLDEKPRRDIIDIYENLFDIHQKMMLGEVSQPIELVWGIGYAVWKIPQSDKIISHPLLEIPVEIELNRDTQALGIRPRSLTQARPRIFTAPFEALNLPGVKPLKEQFENQLDQLEAEDKTIHPADPTSFEGILRTAVSLLSQDAHFVSVLADDVTNRKVPIPKDSLVITDSWAIYARVRGTNYLVRDLERFQEKAKSDEKIEGSVALKFVKEPSGEKPNSGGWSLDGRAAQSSSGALLDTPQDQEKNDTIYFPKPFNDAQLNIIKKLDKSDGVVVQGPPGTGKTHTIANIICHYLATGRRVLVTAKSETALEVLKAQIPIEIQPLIISMVSNDREGMQQQKEAIETLQVKVVGLQGRENRIFKEIKEGEEEVSRLQQDILKIEQQVQDVARKQLEPLELEWAGKNYKNASALAQWVVEHRDSFVWFPDKLEPDKEHAALFGDEDINKLIHAKQTVGKDIEYLNLDIPSVSDLPDTETIERIHHDLVTAKNLESKALRVGVPRFKKESLEAIQTAEQLVQEIRDVENWIRKTEADWLRTFFAARVYPELPAPSWLELVDELRPELSVIAEDRKKFLKRPIDYNANGVNEQAVLRMAVERGKTGKRPLSVTQILNKSAKAIVGSVKILGREPETKEDWRHIEEYLSFEDTSNELRAKWNAIKAEAPIPELQTDRPAKTFDEILAQLEELEHIANKVTKVVWPDLAKVFSKDSGFYRIEPKLQELKLVVDAIDQNLSLYRLLASETVRKEALQRLAKYNCQEAKELCETLTKRIGCEVLETEEAKKIWHSQMARLQNLNRLTSSFQTIIAVTEKIGNSGAVQWANELRQEIFTDREREHLLNWKEAWRWSRLNSLLRSRDVQHKLISLEENRQEKENRIKRVFEEVVQKRTFLMLCQSMTDRAKAGLAKFTAAISKVGRGVGVKAPTFMRAAQKAMLECAEAIPCWIMPSWRVSEVLPAEFHFFDLVIVDEASQCDIRELPTIARAKKLLIVGDDRQVSPTAPFIEFKKFLQLKQNYLEEQPFCDVMLPEYSLYDLASAVFPGNKIILNEHFRCVEPIIRFCFQFYTGVTIHPLRIPKATERIDPPLVDIFVKKGLKRGDLNLGEAEVIVDEIEKIASDNRYESRSIGVISLIGRKQSALIQRKLLERIGQEKYLAHHIVCGDSATFQGREKDIVFLSMVASPGESKAQTTRQMEQRFNVAVSRARDRLYVVRSVELNKLKPSDLKAKLIRHLQEPMPHQHDVDQELVERCDSNFEREVFAALTTRGYLTMPQVPVGEYRIDLVVEGDNDRRLAIELDGDMYHGPERWLEDYTRQKVLERVGWKFWRCWASSYINDPDGCLNSLILRLEDMGIRPQSNSSKSFAYTENRIINTEHEDAEREFIEDFEADDVIEVGDSVILSIEGRAKGSVTVVITANRSEPQNLIFSKDDPTAVALIDKAIDDELEVEILGRRQTVCVVGISKDRSVKGVSSQGVQESLDSKSTTEIKSNSSPEKILIEKVPILLADTQSSVTVHREQEPSEQSPIQPESSRQEIALGITEKYPDPRSVGLHQISKYLKTIVAEHGPMVTEHAYHIYLDKAGIKRLSVQIQENLDLSMAEMIRNGDILVVDHSGTNGQIDMVVKTPNQDDVVIRDHLNRPIERIPKNELQALMKEIQDSLLWFDEEELVRGALERYGLKRLTQKTATILNEVIKNLRD
ncbi:MAG: AAA domain-containing protein [Desulfomonilaceae bacterium]